MEKIERDLITQVLQLCMMEQIAKENPEMTGKQAMKEAKKQAKKLQATDPKEAETRFAEAMQKYSTTVNKILNQFLKAISDYANLDKIMDKPSLLNAARNFCMKFNAGDYEAAAQKKGEQPTKEGARNFLLLELAKMNYGTVAEKVGVTPEELEAVAGQRADEIMKPEKLQPIKVTQHLAANNTLMNFLVDYETINAGAFPLTLNKKRGLTSYTVVTIDPETDNRLSFSKNLSEYERQVSDAVLSIYEASTEQGTPPVFTVGTVYRAMPGGGGKPSTAQKLKIESAIEKLRRIWIKCEIPEEAATKANKGKGSLRLNDHYLNAAGYEFIGVNGKKIEGYKLHSEPLILAYCKYTGQLIRVDSKYLAIEEVMDGKTTGIPLAMTPERQSMTGCLLRRIMNMKGDRKEAQSRLRWHKARTKGKDSEQERTIQDYRQMGDVINFSWVFDEAGVTSENKVTKKRNREFCFSVLDYWTVTGLIKGYEERTEGRIIKGVKIIL